MYGVGDQVIYGIHGVCRVVDLEERSIDRKRVTYLVLEPEGQPGTKYLVPMHNSAAMSKLCRVMTVEQLQALLDSPEIRTDRWIQDEHQRRQAYRELIGSGDRVALMGMVATLWRHKAAQAAAGRKFHQCDENFLRDAEKLLSGEVALVMGLDPDEAKAYLRRHLSCD